MQRSSTESNYVIIGTPINHDSQRGTPSGSAYEGASIIHGTSMRPDQMVRAPHHFDVRGIPAAVYDPHLRGTQILNHSFYINKIVISISLESS